MFILELTGNKTRINVASPMTKMLLRIQLYLTDSKFSNDEKQEVLTQRNFLLRQVKSYINNILILQK